MHRVVQYGLESLRLWTQCLWEKCCLSADQALRFPDEVVHDYAQACNDEKLFQGGECCASDTTAPMQDFGPKNIPKSCCAREILLAFRVTALQTRNLLNHLRISYQPTLVSLILPISYLLFSPSVPPHISPHNQTTTSIQFHSDIFLCHPTAASTNPFSLICIPRPQV